MKPTVVLLHGLTRTDRSMRKMQRALESAGYPVLNIAYPSRHDTIANLAASVRATIEDKLDTDAPVHAVTHSLGGILVRKMRADGGLPNLQRVVMLGPPNQGSEVVDKLGGIAPFRWLNGPAGNELGTGPDSVPNALGPVDFELGVIAGDRSINLLLSQLIPGPDDGKVSVQRAQVEGMSDFIVVHTTHPFMMNNERVITETLHFLQRGVFRPPGEK